MAQKRGMREEREIVNWLESAGFMACRVTGSGAGSKRPRPDILAGDGVNQYGIEVKSSSKEYIHIDWEQIDNLKRFCVGFGAVPLVCAKFTYERPYFMGLDKLDMTEGGNYSVKREYVKEYAPCDLVGGLLSERKNL